MELPRTASAADTLEARRSLEAKQSLALLGAMCFFLSAIEYMIPKPMPFIRIGLANLPLLLALDILSFRRFFLLASIKVLGQALISGTLFSYIFLFSLAGTFASAFAMYILHRVLGSRLVSFIGISTLGAMVSNVSQLALAYIFIFGESVMYIAPPFLFTGIITGVVLGLFCEVFTRQSKWYAGIVSRHGRGQQPQSQCKIALNF